jgi:hypothetical protein
MQPTREDLENKQWYRAVRVVGVLFIAAVGAISAIVFILVLPSIESTAVFAKVKCDNGTNYTIKEINTLFKIENPGVLTRDEFELIQHPGKYTTIEVFEKLTPEYAKSICDHGTAVGFVPDKKNFQIVRFPIHRLLKQWGVPFIIFLSVLAGGLICLFVVRWGVLYIAYGKRK